MTTLLIILGSIILLILILALVMGKDMAIEKTVTIKKPLKEVFEYVRITKNHDNFSVWNMMDPDMKREYSGADGQVGYVYKWDSDKDKNVGAGEQETKKIEDGKLLEYELRFKRPMENVAISKFIFSPVSANETKIQWGFYGPMKFPMNVVKPIFQNVLGKALQQGLDNLKSVLEK